MTPSNEAQLWQDIGALKQGQIDLRADVKRILDRLNGSNGRRRMTPMNAFAGTGWAGTVGLGILVAVQQLGG